MNGTLHGVGVGPGDPDLMTLRAVRVIRAAAVVAYPAPAGGESFARAIAAAAIPAGTAELRIEVPMTAARAPAQAAYDRAAAAIAGHLEAGRDVAVLCEGDPMFYGSFMYLLARLVPRFPVEVVPGVTSLTACAAAARRPLSAREGTLSVIPATLPEGELSVRLAAADAAAVMKVGRHLAKLRRVLADLGLDGDAVYVERASLPEARTLPLAEAPEAAPYFSMVLVRKGADPWLG
jgi:precorrin-2/cobalt-factor-2 C20-methyltransferase